MKKKIALIFLTTMLAVSLCACSSDKDTSSAQSQETESDSSDTDATKTFSTEMGDVEIPVNPQKIVSDYYLGEFLALDVKPIIASPYSLSNPYLADEIDGIEELDIASAETSLEMITAAEPDLIVTLSEADYEKYSKIAPTVYIPSDKYSPEELFYYIGDMLGKEAEAIAYMDQLKADAAAVKDEVTTIVDGRTVSFIEIWPDQIYTFGKNFARGGYILFDLWNLKAPEKVQAEMVDGDKQYEIISLELVPEYAGDFIFYGVLADTDSAFVEDSTVWKSLPAVKDGLAHSYEQVAFMHSDPITLTNQLDYYIDYFRGLK